MKSQELIAYQELKQERDELLAGMNLARELFARTSDLANSRLEEIKELKFQNHRLLEALQELVSIERSDKVGTEYKRAMYAALGKAEAAIAKVTSTRTQRIKERTERMVASAQGSVS